MNPKEDFFYVQKVLSLRKCSMNNRTSHVSVEVKVSVASDKNGQRLQFPCVSDCAGVAVFDKDKL